MSRRNTLPIKIVCTSVKALPTVLQVKWELAKGTNVHIYLPNDSDLVISILALLAGITWLRVLANGLQINDSEMSDAYNGRWSISRGQDD